MALAAAEVVGQAEWALAVDRLLTEINRVCRRARDAGADALTPRLKIAGCLHTMTGAEAFARLRSYLSTAGKQGHSALTVLRTLHDGNPWIPATAG